LTFSKKSLLGRLRLPPVASAFNRRDGEATFAVGAGLVDEVANFLAFLPNWLFLPLV
jgi:hypothetical protein